MDCDSNNLITDPMTFLTLFSFWQFLVGNIGKFIPAILLEHEGRSQSFSKTDLKQS